MNPKPKTRGHHALAQGADFDASQREPFWRRLPGFCAHGLLAASLALVGGCTACADAPPTNPNHAFKVVVLKYATHPALDEVQASFLSSLQQDLGARMGPPLLRNADANRPRAKQLAEEATSMGADLIVALGTPAAQAVATTPSQIPLLYGAVSDPEGAGLLPSGRTTGIRNVNREIVLAALTVIKQAFPNLKRLGTVWNPSEQNSRFVQGLIADAAAELHIELEAREVTSVNHLKVVVEDLLRSTDGIYSANDNLVNMGATAVAATCRERGKPFIIGELSAMASGPTAAVGVDYTRTGIELAKMAKEILLTGSVASSPAGPPPPPDLWVDEKEFHRVGGDLSRVSMPVTRRIEPRRN